jgi:hypothetical protein
MKTCILFNIINHRQENKTETSKPNLTNVLAVSIEKYRDLMFIGSYSVLSTLKDRVLSGL